MCLLQFDLSEKSLVQTAQVYPVDVDRTSSLTPARGHTFRQRHYGHEESLSTHTLTGIGHCQGGTLTG